MAGLDKKAIIPRQFPADFITQLPVFATLLMSGSPWLCKWSNLELQEGVRPSFLPVQCRCHPCVTGMTRTGAQKSGLISRQRRSWEKFAGKRQLLSQIFQHRDLTPEVSRCHASRVLITGSATWHGDTGPGRDCDYPVSGDIGPWYPPGQDHSYLNFTLLVIIRQA